MSRAEPSGIESDPGCRKGKVHELTPLCLFAAFRFGHQEPTGFQAASPVPDPQCHPLSGKSPAIGPHVGGNVSRILVAYHLSIIRTIQPDLRFARRVSPCASGLIRSQYPALHASRSFLVYL